MSEDKPKIVKEEFDMLEKFSSTQEDSELYAHDHAISKQLQKILHSKEDPYQNEMRLEEVETCAQTHIENNQQKALLAYWRYKEDTKEFDCVESFKITEPIPFKDMNYFSGKNC